MNLKQKIELFGIAVMMVMFCWFLLASATSMSRDYSKVTHIHGGKFSSLILMQTEKTKISTNTDKV